MYQEKFYSHRIRLINGETKYFIAFKNGEAHMEEIEVNEEIYNAFVAFQREDNHQHYLNRTYCHLFELSEEELASRSVKQGYTIEGEQDADVLRDVMDTALKSLPEIQQRRFLMHVEESLSFAKIAEIEGCTKRAAAKAVYAAQKTLQKRLSAYRKTRYTNRGKKRH